MLFVILLAIVTVFGMAGWWAPLFVGGIAALIARIRDLTSIGDTTSFDGGPRWMALLMTPLLGSAAAPVGLIVVAALVKMQVVGDVLKSFPSDVSGLTDWTNLTVLAVAAAMGWSAKVLDTMLGIHSRRGGAEYGGCQSVDGAS